MDPLTLMTLLNGGVQLAGGISGMLNQGNDQINPYTDQQMSELRRAQAEAMNQYNAQRAQAAQYTQQLGGVNQNIGRATNQISNVDQPGANDWYDNWLKQVPGFQEIASNLADSSTQDLGRSVDEQIKLDTQNAMTQAMNQFAGNGAYSGAAQAALGKAVAQPMAQARTQMNQTKAGIESGAFNNLAGQAQGLTAGSTQNEFANAMNNLMNQLQGYNTQASLIGNQANLANQAAGQSAGLASNAQAQLSQMADPMLQQRANPFAPMMTSFNNLYGIMTNPDNGIDWQNLGNNNSAVNRAPIPSIPNTNYFDFGNQGYSHPYYSPGE